MKSLLQGAITGVLLLSIAACGGTPSSTDSSDIAANAPGNSGTADTSENPSAAQDQTDKATSTDQATDKPAASDPSESQDVSPAPTNPAAGAQSSPTPAATSSPKPAKQIAANSSNMEEVTIYRLDGQCEDFVAQKMTVPKTDAPNRVVGKVIENSNGPDFKIDNYRVQVKNGTATVDLRLPPDAKRPFTAMSTCEQRSLLGSMQKTLTSNPTLKINSVRFTDGKEDLIF